MVHRMVHRLQDRDTLLVGGVFGEAEMTDSGYPRTLREWKRGTAVEEAPLPILLLCHFDVVKKTRGTRRTASRRRRVRAASPGQCAVPGVCTGTARNAPRTLIAH
mgnify:CR=1 FL=1